MYTALKLWLVLCLDTGNWCQGKHGGKYNFTFDGYDKNEVPLLLEQHIRAGARTNIPFNQVKIRIVLMANFNCES